MLGKSLITAASGAAGAGEALGIESLFQTWLYTGNGSTQTITNGIDLAGEGGMVWIKERNATTYGHSLFDTLRGANNAIQTHTTAQQFNFGNSVSFQNDGFLLGSDPYNYVNNATTTYASWTFRKAPGFFDVVTYTGTSVARTVAHNLGSVPGCIIVKSTTRGSDNWEVYHRSLGNTYNLSLNTTDPAYDTGSSRWNSTTPTSSVFSLGSQVTVNANGASYVAYLFAHDEQIFGEGGDQSVVKCGSYTGTGAAGNFISLGWEPQWVLIKRTDTSGNWQLADTMRGIATGGVSVHLMLNSSSGESAYGSLLSVTATGFQFDAVNADWNASGGTYVYIAIRRGPMRTPTSGTEVLALRYKPPGPVNIGFVPDVTITKWPDGVLSWYWRSRLTNQGTLYSDTAGAEDSSGILAVVWDGPTNTIAGGETHYINYDLGRAPGFFDVVTYTGTGVARTVSHNLGVAPELMIVKQRNGVGNWGVYSTSLGATKGVYLNYDFSEQTDSTLWNNTAPTDAVFTLGTSVNLNQANYTYIAYLFATCPGVSKVFSFTGNGTSQTIDCGFASGARFVLLKRTDSAGNWLVADTARGIVSGNDPLLYLNSPAAEITTRDWIDPHSSGFIVNQEATANANVGGATYIGLAIS